MAKESGDLSRAVTDELFSRFGLDPAVVPREIFARAVNLEWGEHRKSIGDDPSVAARIVIDHLRASPSVPPEYVSSGCCGGGQRASARPVAGMVVVAASFVVVVVVIIVLLYRWRTRARYDRDAYVCARRPVVAHGERGRFYRPFWIGRGL